MKFSCNISLGAVHFEKYLAGKLECDPRPAKLYSWQLQDLFTCITAMCVRLYLKLNKGK